MAYKSQNTIRITSDILPIFAAGLVAFSLLFGTAWAAGGIDPDTVIELANRARAERGQPALVESKELTAAARAKADDMIKNDYFAHTSPSGKDPWYWVKRSGYAYRAAGENLAINFTDAKEQQNAWMKSRTHRDNILNAQYQETGVAVVEGKIKGKNALVTVQLFGTPLAVVADRQTQPIPTDLSAPVAVPEVKGIETEMLPVPSVSPQSELRSAPIVVPAAEAPLWIERAWLGMLILIIVTAVAGPLIIAMVTLRKMLVASMARFYALKWKIAHAV